MGDAAGVVSKAIVDGVIDATIDHDNQCVKSQQKVDIYGSCEPQKAFHKRISFCLQMHNDTVKAMAYPDENDNKGDKDVEMKDAEKDDEKKKEEEKKKEQKKIETKFPQFPKPYPPEFEAYAFLLVLIRLVDKKQREKEAV